MSTAFWLNDPIALVQLKSMADLLPMGGMTMNEKLNALTRMVFLMAVAGYVATKNVRFLFMGAATIGLVVLYHKLARPKVEEAMSNLLAEKIAAQFTVPTPKNPMMNVLLPEINGNPNRKPALPHNHCTTTLVDQQVKKGQDPRLFRGVNDEVDFDNSMRNFYTMPSTTVPNEGFQQFCYAELIDAKTAKEGDPVALGKYKARIGGAYL